MKTYILSGENIYYLENKEVISVEYNTGEIRPGFIKDPRFCLPILIDGNFVENASNEDILIFQKSIYLIKLQEIVTDLRIKAKGAAIGKTGTKDYIEAQQEYYEIKYNQCVNLTNSIEIEQSLQNEADEFGISLELFKALVIQRYTEAKEKYNLFMRMIERCRTKIQTLIENNNWENVEAAFSIISTLNNVDQAQDIMNDILIL